MSDNIQHPHSLIKEKRPLSFLDLDYDIRLIIYAELRVRSKAIVFAYDKSPFRKAGQVYPLRCHARYRSEERPYPAILCACKTTYFEAMPILYAENIYGDRGDMHRHLSWAEHFVSIIGRSQASLVKHFELNLLGHAESSEILT
jgi:hypothetical protein